MVASETIDRDFLLRGPAAQYYQYEGREALLEGGTRCSKSWSFMIKAKDTADRYPKSRQMITRQTRKSLNESILKDWREDILWTGHEAVSGSASKEHQDLYRWRNGAEVFFCGLEGMRDTASPILSSQWDRIYICQAEETEKNDWEVLATRLSSFKTPYHQITADCNPAAPSHWLNTRFAPDLLGPDRARFAFRHYDNPLFYDGIYPDGEWTPRGDEYMGILEGTLTGVRRSRYLLNQWAADANQILENWNPRVHSIHAELERDPHHGWLIHLQGQENPIRVAYFTCGVDWGWHPDPGCLSLWAYDSPRWHPHIRRFRVAEVMKLKWQREEWAELAESWWKDYGISWFSCDPSDPENINYFRIRLGKANRRNAPPLAIKCPPIGGGHQRSKHHSASIDLMREGLGAADGHVRSFFLKNAFWEGIDEEMRRTSRPTCFEQEVESWTYEVDSSGNPTSKPSPKCDQHACLVGETEIETARGLVPLQDVMIGDRVLVPYEDEVVATWQSEGEEPVWEMMTSMGRLVGTGNHGLWTQRGWTPLEEIEGARLLAWARKSLGTTASPGIATHTLMPTLSGATSRVGYSIRPFSFTATSGSVKWAGDEWEKTFTTSMAILPTTGEATSSRSLPVSTGSITRLSSSVVTESWNGTRIPRTMKRGAGVGVFPGRTGKPDHELAEYVVWCTAAALQIRERACVAQGVGSSTGGTLTPTIITASVPRRIGSARVFNITTARSGRYIANGIMVSNCMTAMYDETLSFVRGFGKKMEMEPRAKPGTAEALMEELERERVVAKRKKNQRRSKWE